MTDKSDEVTKIFYAQSIIHLIGTAHFSKKSNNLVYDTIQREKPDAVFLEICNERIPLATSTDEELKVMIKNAGKPTVKGKSMSEKAPSMLQNLLLKASSSAQDKLEMLPGGEMRAAYQSCMKLNRDYQTAYDTALPLSDGEDDSRPEYYGNKCKVVFGDRPVSQTLARAFNPLSYYQKMRLAYSFLNSINEMEAITTEEVEKAKNEDEITKFINEMKDDYPEFAYAMIDERNQYMVGKLQETAKRHKNIVAVVGAGHVPGMVEIFEQGKSMARYSQKIFFEFAWKFLP